MPLFSDATHEAGILGCACGIITYGVEIEREIIDVPTDVGAVGDGAPACPVPIDGARTHVDVVEQRGVGHTVGVGVDAVRRV